MNCCIASIAIRSPADRPGSRNATIAKRGTLMSDMPMMAVVGAGLAGLTAALRLTEAGQRVKVFERYARPGGLARVLEVEGEPLEAFYHHLFTSDDVVRRSR